MMDRKKNIDHVKPQVIKTPTSSRLPLWLVTSFVLSLVSLISFIYYFILVRVKPKSRQGNFSTPHPHEPKQAAVDQSNQALDIIKNRPVFTSPITGTEQSEQKPTPVLTRFEAWISHLFPNLATKRIKMASFSVIGFLLVIAIVFIAKGLFDTTTVAGGLALSFILFLVSLLFLLYIFLRSSKTRRQGNIPDPCAGVEQPGQQANPIAKGSESLEPGLQFELSPSTMEKVAFSTTGVLLALLMAYAAQGIFDSIKKMGIMQNFAGLENLPEASRLWLGAGLYLACMLVWSLAAPAMRSIDPVGNLPGPFVENDNHLIRSILLPASIGLYLVSVLLFVLLGENTLIRGLWASGLVCFILSQLPRANSHPEAEESPRFVWYHWLILALILGAAFWLRFYRISIIPDDLHGDMAEHGWIARNYLLGIEKNIFGYGFYGIPSMGFLPAAFSMAVFGNNIFGLQMTSVLGGMLNLFAVYLVIWRLFNNHRLAALTTALAAINITHIHFSRIVDYMDPWTFGVFALFFLIDGLKARRAPSFGLAGVFLGISMQMYFSGRVLIFIIGFFLIHAFFFKRAWIIQNRRSLLWMAFGTLVAMGPALVSHFLYWEEYIGRGRGVFIFSPEALNHLFYGYNTDSAMVVLLIQIKRSLLMFNQINDTSGQFGYPNPMFSSLVSPLVVLGLGYAIRRWKDAGMAFMLIWLVLLFVLGSVLTIDPPFSPRLVGIIPAAAFLAAVTLEQLLELGRRILGVRAVVFIMVLMAIFLAAVGFLNWNEYYSIVKNNGSPPAVAGRFINRLPLDVTACGIFNDFQFSSHGTTTFLIWPRKLVDITPDAPDSALDACAGSSLVWVVSPENIGRLDAIRARWPDGLVHKITNHEYTLTFYLIGVDLPAYE